MGRVTFEFDPAHQRLEIVQTTPPDDLAEGEHDGIRL